MLQHTANLFKGWPIAVRSLPACCTEGEEATGGGKGWYQMHQEVGNTRVTYLSILGSTLLRHVGNDVEYR